MHGRRAGKIGALNSIKLKKHHVKGWRPFQGGALLIGTGPHQLVHTIVQVHRDNYGGCPVQHNKQFAHYYFKLGKVVGF